MKVAISGMFFPMAILRYFEAALKRHPEVELCTVGPYTGRMIPWNGGMELPEQYAKPPDVQLPAQAQAAFGYVETKLPWQPDVWIQVDAGFHIKGHPTRAVNVIVATDPHCLNYDYQRATADLFFNMQTPYMKEGDHYIPYAYDPVWHAHKEMQTERPAALVGMRYQNRDMWVAALRGAGIDVLYQTGPVFDEANMIYNTSSIGLNWSSMEDTNARVFEVMAMCGVGVFNRTPDLMEMFKEGVEFLGFSSIPEGVKQVKLLIADTDLRRRMESAGRIAVKEHTYDARIRTILAAAAAL